MTFIFVGYLLVNIALSILVAYVAGQKGRSKGGFFLISFLFSFIVGILVVIAVPKIEQSGISTSRGTKLGATNKQLCPHCNGEIMPGSLICKHCGKKTNSVSLGEAELIGSNETGAFAAALEESEKQKKKK